MAKPVITDKPVIDQAEFNGVTIWRKEGGSIEVSDTNYPSMKAALQDIADKAGIKLEEGWNTQYMGWYIIQQLKGDKDSKPAEKVLEKTVEQKESQPKESVMGAAVNNASVESKKEEIASSSKEEKVAEVADTGTKKNQTEEKPAKKTPKVEPISFISDVFDDDKFRQYCFDKLDSDKDGVISAEEILGFTVLEEYTSYRSGSYQTGNTRARHTEYWSEENSSKLAGVKSFKGIERFVNLETIKLPSDVCVESLDLSQSKNLKHFEILRKTRQTYTYSSPSFYDTRKSSKIGKLVLNDCPELEEVICNKSQISSLSVSGSSNLQKLECCDNSLSSLDVSENKKLTTLKCSANQLSALDVSKNKELISLDCSNNKLTALDISANTELQSFSCGSNSFSEINVFYNKKLNPHSFSSGSAKVIMTEPVKKVEVKVQEEAPVKRAVTTKGKRDGEVVIELKEPGTLMSYIVENGVDMASIKCLTLKGSNLNDDDKKFVKTIAESYGILETIDLSDVQMETVSGFGSTKSVKEFILPTSATSIGDSAFQDCKALIQVTIPDSISTIGKSAFRLCSSLQEITLPKELKRIEYNTFNQCVALKSIVFPEGLEYIGAYAFAASGLESVVLPSSLKDMDLLAFVASEKLSYFEVTSKMAPVISWDLNGYSNTAGAPYDCLKTENQAIVDKRLYSDSRYNHIPKLKGKKVSLLGSFDFTNISKIYVPKASLPFYAMSDWSKLGKLSNFPSSDSYSYNGQKVPLEGK